MSADIVLTNGRVWTGLRDRPDAQSLAVSGDRIVAVGAASEVDALRGPDARVIDLGGRLAVPGFHDCHVHFAGGCLQLQRVDLRDAPDEAEFGRRLRAFADGLPECAWIVGGRWDHDLTFGGEFPTAVILDRYVPDRPVFVRRYDGHVAVANALAVRIADVTRDTPDPSGGALLRDPSGAPTGVLADSAMDLVWRHIPDPTADDIATALPGGLALAASKGITSVHDMLGDGGPCLDAYTKLRDSGDLTVRLNLYWPLSDWRRATELADPSADWVRVIGTKAFVDGSLGACTAWFHDPYVCLPDTSGFACVDMDWLAEAMAQADAARLQLAVHAIGDRAISELLDAWERVVGESASRDRRLRMEHCQHIRRSDLPRFAALGVIASVQPYHTTDDARFCEARIGADRCAEAYTFRSLLDAGVPLALGSDWPVAPLDALLAIDSAVNRRPAGETEPWQSQERITAVEALRGLTLGASRAAFIDDRLGTLEPGKLADIAVLSRDITDGVGIDETEVSLTIAGGRVVHDSGLL